MFGFLVVDKPRGITSRDAVDCVARALRPQRTKVGHAGTLDPLAVGVLVVGIGRATRLLQYVQCEKKTYRATFRLGCTSPTEDADGPVEEITAPPMPSRAELDAVLPRFQGELLQRPPAFSAVKVQGKRAHQLARRGQPVQLEPRRIVVERIDLLRYEYPVLEMDVRCGGGTYVRSLGRDIAEALGTGAVMTDLVRSAIGPFRREDAVDVDSLDQERIDAHLMDPLAALGRLPHLRLDAAQEEDIRQGRNAKPPFEWVAQGAEGQTDVAAVDAMGHLAAILIPGPDGELRPRRVFPPG